MCIYTFTYIYVYIYMYTYIYNIQLLVYRYIDIPIHTYLHTYTFIYIYIYIYIFMYQYIQRTNMYTFVYTYTYTYIGITIGNAVSHKRTTHPSDVSFDRLHGLFDKTHDSFKMIQYTARPSNRPMRIDRALLTECMAFVKKDDSCHDFGVFSSSVSRF